MYKFQEGNAKSASIIKKKKKENSSQANNRKISLVEN